MSTSETRTFLIIANIDKQTIGKAFEVDYRKLSGAISDEEVTADDLVRYLRDEISNLEHPSVCRILPETFAQDGFGKFAEVVEEALISDLEYNIEGFFVVEDERIIVNTTFQAISLGLKHASVIAMWS